MSVGTQDTWEGRAYIGGWVQLADRMPVVSPSTGEPIASVALGAPADVETAVSLAVDAQPAWALTPPGERAAVLRRAGDLLNEHRAVARRWLSDEAGSATAKAEFEIGLVISELYQAAATALIPFGQLLRSELPRLSFSRRLPVGVVGVISPFNFPAVLSARSVAPALALGNGVVLKPDPRTTVSGGLLLAAILEAAGVPAGVFSVVPGAAAVGQALVTDPRVPVISFTGSTAAGRAIGALGAESLKRVHLELGGNNALVILDDADIAAAAAAGAWGSFLHQGQICMTTGRHFVPERLAAAYERALVGHAERLRAGPPEDGAELGPLIDAPQRDRVHDLVTRSVAAGARLATGGTYDGLHYRPTVLAEVAPGHPASTEEIFGPVAPIVRYRSEDELVQLVNASPYGLSVGVLSGNAMRAYELAGQFRSGILHINDQTVDDEAQAPFGGVGAWGPRGPERGLAVTRPISRRSPRPSGSPCRGRSPRTACSSGTPSGRGHFSMQERTRR
ncbi:Aldehyde dehydrogenase [Leucobacter sp. 7(1)]|uniref:aldehyde dehydrogenase family protein n=1 Tax=Leucobacter sp. 7(1) TaxID=1255613 RepID=UPI00097F567F|nr:aldehyde dehydrogenase family protein [Leucobacter sp. 7(1)]SJN08626.1 Aldehyde dehydrogenase [Leucobacter sp. 7(1)]